ncbi:diaminopimelate decarboxylase [soil metagenome]
MAGVGPRPAGTNASPGSAPTAGVYARRVSFVPSQVPFGRDPAEAARFADAARAAAEQFGTPLYLYDLRRLAADAQAISAAFPDPWLRLYSLKANGLPGLVRRVARHGFGANCVSGGELGLAARAGIAPGRTTLEGIGKTDADLDLVARLAAEGRPLLWVALESAEEAAALADRLRRIGARQDALVRVNPQVVAETSAGLAVGAATSKFGVLPEELEAVIEASGGRGGLSDRGPGGRNRGGDARGPIRWRGLHLHVGSMLGAVDAWRSAIRLGLRLLELQRAALPEFDTLDLGGGFPVADDEASVPSVARFASEAAAEIEQLPAAARPARLAIEPGRAVVAASGWVVGRVLHVRARDPEIIVLDAGMTELIRPALYGAQHPIVALTSDGRPVAGAEESGATHKSGATDKSGAQAAHVRVDGPICESTDTLGQARLPPLVRGDVVAVGLAGAYASSMFSSYNGRLRPPEIGWDGRRLVALRPRGRRVE